MRYILWISVVLAVGLYICGPIVDPDLWWHITVGKWILHHREIPSVDHWNLFGAGTPWRAYSWSNEVVLALLDGAGGHRALLLAKLFLGIALAGSLFYCLGKIADDYFFGALLGVFATCATYNHFTLRPQTLVWLFLIWTLFFTDRVERQGHSKGSALAVFGIFVAWANTHITTALGLLAVFLWLARPGRKPMRLALGYTAIALAGTLVTPYFGGEWLTFFSKTGHPFAHASIAEFQPATIMQFSTGFLVLILAFLLAFLHHRPRALELPKLALAGGFTLGALAVVKFLPFAVMIVTALVARLWRVERGAPAELGNLAEAVHRLRAQFHRIPSEGLSFVFLCLAAVNAYQVWEEPVSSEVVPIEAVDFMQRENLPHPILNDFGRGGYIMYRYSDGAGELEHLVPIDGRTNVTPHDVWEKFHSALFGKHNWREYLELVSPKTILWKTESPLSSILVSGNDWCLVMRTGSADTGYLVFVERSYYLRRLAHLSAENCAVDDRPVG